MNANDVSEVMHIDTDTFDKRYGRFLSYMGEYELALDAACNFQAFAQSHGLPLNWMTVTVEVGGGTKVSIGVDAEYTALVSSMGFSLDTMMTHAWETGGKSYAENWINPNIPRIILYISTYRSPEKK